MYLTEILTILNADNRLPQIYAYEAKQPTATNFIVYNTATLSNNRAIRADYLKFNITASTYASCLDYAEYIREDILTLGDAGFSVNILKVAEGSGSMNYNDEQGYPHVIISFTITSRANLTIS